MFGPLTTHGVHHFFAQLHRRWKRLRVTAKDISKVDMEQLPALRQQKIIEVAIANSKKISNDTISSYKRRNRTIVEK